jgi:hypothetical protein
MITINKAIDNIRKKFKGYHITQAINYDENWFVFCVLKNLDKVNFDAPYYAVNKQTGDICSFTPMMDLNKFIIASRERSYKVT